MFIKVKDSDNVVDETRSTAPYLEEDGFTMYTDADPSFVSGGTYDGETYTPSVPPAEETWITAFKTARDELFGDDPKDIASGSMPWMKCVMYDAMGRMDQACKDDIVTAYGL